MFQHKGMNTHYAQSKDRAAWNQSIQQRTDIVEQLEEKNINLKNPHGMKIKDLIKEQERENMEIKILKEKKGVPTVIDWLGRKYILDMKGSQNGQSRAEAITQKKAAKKSPTHSV